MARKRMIDPNIWQSEDFSKLTTLAKLIFIGLFSLADDEGRGRCNPVYLKSTLFPYEEGIRSADIDKTLSEISSNMSVLFYSHDGSNYYSLYNWNTWQKIDKPSASKIPEYIENKSILLFDESSTNARRVVSPNKKENKNINRKEIEDKRNKVIEIYNQYCSNLPRVQKITDKRQKAIDKFIDEFTEEQIIEICQKANISDFLTGKNDRNWKADFDFIMRIDKATNILENKYNQNADKVCSNPFLEIAREEKMF